MANPMVDPQERQPAPPPLSAPSPFLWSGLALLALAAFLGISTIMQAGNTEEGTLGKELLVAFLLFLCAVTLLFAQARYSFWRRAAGIVEPHPLAPISHKVREENESYLKRGEWSIVLFLIALALLPRVPALNHSFWYGELNSLEFMKHGPLYALTHQSGFSNHLLNSLLGNLVIEAFGVTNRVLAPPVWMARLPAFLFGVLSVPMLYLATREAFSRPAGIAAALLLAFSPAAVDLSTQARGYSALIFFTIAQAYFLCRALRLNLASAWIGWLLCALLGVMAHLYFVFIVGVNLIYLCIRAIWRSAYLRAHPHAIALIEQAIVFTIAWGLLFCVAYSGIGPTMLEEAKRASEFLPVARAREVMLPLLQLWGGVPRGPWLPTYYIATGVFALCGLYYLVHRPSGGALYIPLLLLAPPLIVEIVQPHYVYLRFFAFGLPLFLTLLACGMTQLARWITGSREHPDFQYHAALLIPVGLYILLCMPGLWQVIHLPKQDYRSAASLLSALDGSNPLAGVGTGAKLFQQYGVDVIPTEDEETLRALARPGKTITVVDTNMTLNPRLRPSSPIRLVQQAAGRPERIFPGRFAGWKHRWMDGDSDIKIYRIEPRALAP